MSRSLHVAGRNQRASMGFVGVAVALCVFVLVLFWPYLLGEWLARELGAAEGSSAATATGWTFEGLYVVAIAAVVVLVLRRRQLAAREATRREVAGRLSSLIHQSDERIRLLELLRERMDDQPAGVRNAGVPADERLLMVLDGVHLVEPRVQVRGAPPVPTFVRPGSLLVTDRAIRHRSDRANLEWRFDRIQEQHPTATFVTWRVSNRKTVSGVGGSEALVEAIECLGLWARALPDAPDQARRRVAALLRQARSHKEDLQIELARLAEPPEDEVTDAGLLGRVTGQQLFAGTAVAAALVVALGLVAGLGGADPSRDAAASDTRDEEPAAPYDRADEVGDVRPDDEPGRRQQAPASGGMPREPRDVLVTRVVDGDTVELGNGETVRIVGIDTPEVGECGFGKASARLAALVQGRRVTLGASDEDRDQYDRLLRYVDVGARDAGLSLIKEGLAIARYDSRDGYGRHPREEEYVAADLRSRDVRCAPAPRNLVDTGGGGGGGGRCEPGYSPCVPLYPPDLDCADVDGPLAITGSDPHELDADGDGRACE